MKLEVIALTVEDAQRAERGGAHRLELIADLANGGVTPSLETIRAVTEAVHIPVHVMVRPTARLDFIVTADECATMIATIAAIRETKAAGVVLGCLTAERTIDEATLQQLLAEVGDLQVTFHRAIDESRDLREAVHVLNRNPRVTRILTSGGVPNVTDAVTTINELQREAKAILLAGSGFTLDNLAPFLAATSVTEVHFGTGVRTNGVVDETKVAQALAQLRRA